MVVAGSWKNTDQTWDLDSVDVNPLRPQRTKGCLYSFLGELREAGPAGLVGLLAYSTCQRGLHGGPAPSEQGPSLREGRYLDHTLQFNRAVPVVSRSSKV